MPRRATGDTYPGKVAIRRAIDTARACGLDVTGFKVGADGSIVVHSGQAPNVAEPVDEYLRLKAAGVI